MRLTLRTLLAHEHGLLNEQQAELISQKIDQSPFVAQLLRHLKDRAARREIVPLAIEARGSVCLEKVTRYLDYTLPAEEVVKLENECFASDRLLAEVSSCHEIISQWLSTPTPTEPALRQRLYAIMPGPIGEVIAPSDELAIDLPALAYQSSLPRDPSVEKEFAAPPTPVKSSWLGGAFRLATLAASVLALVTFMTMNRDKVEAMIAQHWQVKSQVDSDPQEGSRHPVGQVPPEALASQAKTISPIETSLPEDAVPALLPEVATTAFHMPIPIDRKVVAGTAWQVNTAKGSLYQRVLEETWQTENLEALKSGRVVVSPGGQLTIAREGIQLEAQQLSEFLLSEDDTVEVRYGSYLISIDTGRELAMEIAGQNIKISAQNDPVRLEVSTQAVVSRGLDFSASTANQEVCFHGMSGQAELTIPGCRGPIPLGHDQVILSHLNSGVRGGEKSALRTLNSELPVSTFGEALQTSREPIRFLRELLSSETHEQRCNAAMTLAQLGYTDCWPYVWSQKQNQQLLDPLLSDLQQLLAQDAALASEMKTVLSLHTGEHWPLIYRLICGFSDDQLTEETRVQLETLLRHPDPAVQAWTRFQLSL